jgi:hypothetical protein
MSIWPAITENLTISDVNLRRGGGGRHTQLILNSRAIISTIRVTFKETSGTAVANWQAGSIGRLPMRTME